MQRDIQRRSKTAQSSSTHLLLLLLEGFKRGLPRPGGGFLMNLGSAGPQGPAGSSIVQALMVAVARCVCALSVPNPLPKRPCPAAVGSSPARVLPDALKWRLGQRVYLEPTYNV